MIYIASDHGGYALKQELMDYLKSNGYEYEDRGCYDTNSVDYPVYAKDVCEAVQSGKADKGILVCGTGIGMCICANKFAGIRASLPTDCYSAQMTREHNDSNVICFGGRTIGPELARKILEIYLETPFSGLEKHSRRIGMIKEMEG